MRSHLTPRVFRRLLSSKGLTFRCPSQSYLATQYRIYHRPRNVASPLFRTPPRRSLWGFSKKPPRQPRDPELDPGLSKMFDLMTMEKLKARPPPPSEMVRAWRAFFTHKEKKGEPVNNLQARHVLKTLKFLQSQPYDGDDPSGTWLNDHDISRAKRALNLLPDDQLEAHNELARLLYVPYNKDRNLKGFVRMLALTGDAAEARQITKTHWDGLTEDDLPPTTPAALSKGRELWHLVLAGFAKEGNQLELVKTWEIAENSGVPYLPASQMIMTAFFAERNDIQATKKWYNKALEQPHPDSKILEHLQPRNRTLDRVLKFCIRNDQLEWSKTVFRDILEMNPKHKGVWDIVFQWAAGALGKGVEDVERMMDVMVRRSPDNEVLRPDIDTINGLAELAMSLKDPYLAERYITLGQKYGIRPNARTYILQMNYRTDAGDLTGAQAAYEALQSEEIMNEEDLPAINKYIQALCLSKTLNYDRITSITSDLEERNARLESQTVAALSMMYLQRGEVDEALDLAQVHVYHYTISERAQIRDAFLSFCCDRANSTVSVWETYILMRNLFDETSIEIRTQMMNEFFARNRSDMACHTFGHMRQHIDRGKRPVLETYIQCFEGIARCEDRESLDMVHNMLKMDSSIEPSTKLYNSLMLAYTACEESDRALDFWSDITNSTEGPSYRSLEIVFGACQRKPFGDKVAREIWAKMRRMEIEVTNEVFRAYVGALAGQGMLEDAKTLVEEVEGDLGLKVDALTLGIFYNALPGQNRKDLVEEWAKELYPQHWAELEKLGQKSQKEGHRLFNIRSEIKA